MAEPIHARIRADLKTRIAAGEWAPGQRIDSTRDLVAHYREAMNLPTLNASTVRHAITVMVAVGELHGRQGLGVFVPLPATDDGE